MIAVTASMSKVAEQRWLGWMKDSPTEVYRNYPENIGLVPAYHKLWEALRTDYESICYFHDDVEIYPDMVPFIRLPWETKVRGEFLHDPKVAIVGFGGASSMGAKDIYKQRYDIRQLARSGYRSNQRGWDIHGTQETENADVVVVDGFALCVRTDFLNQIGGWSWFPHKFHCYDTALCLMALRHGWKVRMVGIECDHHGGGTSTTPEYLDWCKENATTPEREHEEPHRWLYEEFRDILPVSV
jgi:hypothetical protein